MTTTDIALEVGRASSLQEALHLFIDQPFTGVLRIVTDEAHGQLGIEEGIVTGALITTTSETGEMALRKLLRTHSGGFFQFNSTPHQALTRQNLNLKISEILKDEFNTKSAELEDTAESLFENQLEMMAVYKSLSPGDTRSFETEWPGFKQMMEESGLTAEKLEWFTIVHRLANSTDKKAFLERNRELVLETMENLDEKIERELTTSRDKAINDAIDAFLTKSEAASLNPSILNGLKEEYRKLRDARERDLFFHEHPQFAQLMTDSGLTEEQAAELNKVRDSSVDDAVAAFIEFRRSEQGDDAQVSETEIAMLRETYKQVSSQLNGFLWQDPMLSNDLPVVRGEEALEGEEEEEEPPAPDDPFGYRPSQQAESLVAQDGDYRIEQPTNFVQSRQIVFGTREKQEIVQKFSWAAVIVIAGAIGFLGVAHMHKVSKANMEQPPVEYDSDSLVEDQVTQAVRSGAPTSTGRVSGGGQDGRSFGKFYNAAALQSLEHVQQNLKLAERLLADGKTSQAVTLLWDILREDPDCLAARMHLIRIYTASKDYAQARLLCVDGIKRSSSSDERAILSAMLRRVMVDPR